MEEKNQYHPQETESKWQESWAKEKIYKVDLAKTKHKFYCLVMFIYPSGDKLHIGHWYNYGPADSYARFKKMQGFNVFSPIGYDAFGLPAENYAIKQGIHPKLSTTENVKYIRGQLKAIGAIYDWDYEINTSEPDYYKWTQWVFLQLYKKGLAYREKAKVNWCPSCQTVLANEQVKEGLCERCDQRVIQKEMTQWFFKITEYAEELLNHQGLDWPAKSITMQKNWIGKSEGALIKFKVPAFVRPGRASAGRQSEKFKVLEKIEVFTTRPDTIFGATYLVVAPEHPLVARCLSLVANRQEVENYSEKSQKKSELERTELAKEKTGVELKGIKVINPANQKEIPVWVADYVVMSYGTGAIMAVPAHDERDWEFAKKYDLPIVQVITSSRRTALILHGTDGHSKKNWYPWLKCELEARGYKVFVPDLPNSDQPNLESWLTALKSYKDKIDEHSLIIGHSLGAITALQFIQFFNLKVGTLVLVAPTHARMDWKLIDSTHPNDQAANIRAFTQTSLNWQIVRRNVGRVIGMFSTDDFYIPASTKALYESDLPGSYIMYKQRGHFNHRTGITELPELLELIYMKPYLEDGFLVNSGQFNGLDSVKAKEEITKFVGGQPKVNYKLHDWLISRQRYWGAPIPIIYCPKCGEVAVPEKDLPVRLPEEVDFKPTGEPPLARSKKFVETKCPKCGGSAKREVDTMDTFVCSAWYYFRYLSPHNDKKPFDKKLVAKWLPVDMYVGGAEHVTMHLIYARFIAKVLMDDKNYEPFKALRHQGTITKNGAKMSKSRGNVVIPDQFIKKYGSDCFRMFLMFMGPYEEGGDWNDQGVLGIKRFLERIWNVFNNKASQGQAASSSKSNYLLHQTIKKVTEDLENFRFNTAISSLMILFNELSGHSLTKNESEVFLKLLAPLAPHLVEELWQKLGHQDSIFKEKWPVYDPKMIRTEEVEIVIQVNGKLRDTVKVATDSSEAEVKRAALASQKVKNHLKGEPKKVIFVKNKLINFVM